MGVSERRLSLQLAAALVLEGTLAAEWLSWPPAWHPPVVVGEPSSTGTGLSSATGVGVGTGTCARAPTALLLRSRTCSSC